MTIGRLAACCLALGMALGDALGVPPTIHVLWKPGDPPDEGADYFIINAGTDFPGVALISSHDSWFIWSTDPDNSQGIGDIGVISTPAAGHFGVTLVDYDSGAPGARHVQGITLDPPTRVRSASISASE